MFVRLRENQPLIIPSLSEKFSNFGILPPLPYKFVTHQLQSSLAGDLSDVITKIDTLMPQLHEFIGQFHNVIINNNIGVITEANGNMSIDVPTTMPDHEAQTLSQRISVIDRLITTRGQEINSLLQQGLGIETKIKEQDPQFSSRILEKVNEFNNLNNSYKH